MDELVSGKSFSEAVRQKNEFTEYEFYSLKIGEETGTTHTIAEELGGNSLHAKNAQRRNLVNALTYPIIILVNRDSRGSLYASFGGAYVSGYI